MIQHIELTEVKKKNRRRKRGAKRGKEEVSAADILTKAAGMMLESPQSELSEGPSEIEVLDLSSGDLVPTSTGTPHSQSSASSLWEIGSVDCEAEPRPTLIQMDRETPPQTDTSELDKLTESLSSLLSSVSLTEEATRLCVGNRLCAPASPAAVSWFDSVRAAVSSTVDALVDSSTRTGEISRILSRLTADAPVQPIPNRPPVFNRRDRRMAEGITRTND